MVSVRSSAVRSPTTWMTKDWSPTVTRCRQDADRRPSSSRPRSSRRSRASSTPVPSGSGGEDRGTPGTRRRLGPRRRRSSRTSGRRRRARAGAIDGRRSAEGGAARKPPAGGGEDSIRGAMMAARWRSCSPAAACDAAGDRMYRSAPSVTSTTSVVPPLQASSRQRTRGRGGVVVGRALTLGHPVADAADRLDPGGAHRPELAAQERDEGVDRVRGHRHAERPGHVEELVARQGVARVAQQALEQRELAEVSSTGRPSTVTRRAFRRARSARPAGAAGPGAVARRRRGRSPGAARRAPRRRTA